MNESSARPRRSTRAPLIAALLMAGCASAPPTPASIPPLAAANAAIVPFATLRERGFDYQNFGDAAIVKSQDSSALRAHLALKLRQVQASFLVGRRALQEFDQLLSSSHDADFLKRATDAKIFARIQGANIYRNIAENQLVAAVIELECRASEEQGGGRAMFGQPAPGGATAQQAVETLTWLKSKIGQATGVAQLALLPYAEKLLAATGANLPTTQLTEHVALSVEQLAEIEHQPGLQQEIAKRGRTATLIADRELQNWILHFAKSQADIASEYEYVPTLVGRKHSFSIRNPASAGAPPAAGLATRSADPLKAQPSRPVGAASSEAAPPHPLRPFSARNLNENEFALIFEGQTHLVYTAALASELLVEARPATLFMTGSDLRLAGAKRETWVRELGRQKLLVFGSQGETLKPISLESDAELTRSVDHSLTSLTSSHLPQAPFLKPSFESESGRLGKIARDRGLRLVRANIESFDEIDFAPERVAARVTQQTALLKSGIIRMQLGSPRGPEIQRNLTRQLLAIFKDSKSAPHFVALSQSGGGA